MKSVKPRAEVELRICKSKDTGILYYGLFEKDNPIKYWEYDEVSDAGKDLIEELLKAFDLGYDVRFQFPIKDGDGKKIVPRIVKMFNEPKNENKKAKDAKIEETFYQSETNKDEDEDA